MIQYETEEKLLEIDAPTGLDDYLVIFDQSTIYPLPTEWRVYDMEDW